MGLINVIKPLLSTALSSSAVNLPGNIDNFFTKTIYLGKKFRNARNRTLDCWVQSEKVIRYAKRPPQLSCNIDLAGGFKTKFQISAMPPLGKLGTRYFGADI